MIDRDFAKLHPTVRFAVRTLLTRCDAKGLHFAMFEGFRSRERQAALYAQGRTVPGKIVTYARPGESYHQYGLAADIVGFVDGKWTWNLPGADWDVMHQIASELGLETLSFETPHVQLKGLKILDLMAGRIPPGDESWRNALSVNVAPTAPKVLSADDLNQRELDRISRGRTT